MFRYRFLVAGALALGAVLPVRVDAATQHWRITDATATLSLDPDHLANLGLRVVDARPTSERSRPRELALEAPAYSFASAAGLTAEFKTRNGSFDAFAGEALAIPLRGGFSLRADAPGSAETLAPTPLHDFAVELDLSDRRTVRLRTSEELPVPLEVRGGVARFDPKARQLSLPGDLVVSESWASSVARPEIAGQWVGLFDLRVGAELVGEETIETVAPPSERGQLLDVVLAELYGITVLGRVGTYPNGQVGLAASTTACNAGEVEVPWDAPMAETHPLIGFALFRLKNGVLEMLSKSWLKHVWASAEDDVCSFDCVGGGGSNVLSPGCSDTYTAGLNGNLYFLGPREEVNPFTAEWEACGSFFDATPVDCERDYFGQANDPVEHRLSAWDDELGDPDSEYYYEGEFFVADDDRDMNNIGYRRCHMVWNGITWNFTTIGTSLWKLPGTVMGGVLGGVQTAINVPGGDGRVILAINTTDQGGTWHYEYALYNRHSDRGVYSFSVPIEGANVMNVGFRDIDRNPDNDWVATIANGLLTWSTDDYATDPDANALPYQTLFNFRFDADVPPTPSAAIAGIFEPGGPDVLFIDTEAPAAGATSVAVEAAEAVIRLAITGANPFSEGTRLEFSLPRKSPTRLSVVDVTGRVVRTLVDGVAPAGRTSVAWNGRDEAGARIASGVYFFRLETSEGVRTVKGTIIR